MASKPRLTFIAYAPAPGFYDIYSDFGTITQEYSSRSPPPFFPFFGEFDKNM